MKPSAVAAPGRSAVRHAQALRRAERRRVLAARYGATVLAAAAAYPGVVGPDAVRFPAGVACGAALAAAVAHHRLNRRVPGPVTTAEAPEPTPHRTRVSGPRPLPLAAAPSPAAQPPPAPAASPAPTGRRRRPAPAAEEARSPQHPPAHAVAAGDDGAPGAVPRRRRAETSGKPVPRSRDRRSNAQAPGTRRTEDTLRPLAREGWVIRPDLAAAFHGIAHVAVGPPGVFLLDSGHWDDDIRIDAAGVPHTRRLGGAGDPDRIPRQLRLAAAEHHEVLAGMLGGKRPWVHPVAVVWALWDSPGIESEGLAYVRGDVLADWLRDRRPVYTREEIAQLVDALARLPINVGTEYAR